MMSINHEMAESGQNEPEILNSRKSNTPDVDIFINDEEILLVADLPGVSRENLAINLENNRLIIEGTFSVAFVGSCQRAEFCPNDYRRVFTLPKGIDVEKVRAEFKNGVLFLHLPKSSTTKPFKIAVNGD